MKYHASLEHLRPTFETELEELVLIECEQATERHPVKSRTILEKHLKNTGERMDVRRIQEVVQQLRFLGMPICANGHGYYWPSDAIELENYIDVMKRRVKELSVALAALKKSYGQINIRAEREIEAD